MNNKYIGYIDFHKLNYFEFMKTLYELNKEGIDVGLLSIDDKNSAFIIKKNKTISLIVSPYKDFIQDNNIKDITRSFLNKNIFIATAMSNLSETQYSELRISINNFKSQNKDLNIFSEITNIDTKDLFLSPKDGTERDIFEINNSDHFILLHLSSTQSSTLFELGIAFSKRKKITIIYLDENDLPYMLQELDEVSENVELIKINNLKEIENKLKEVINITQETL